MNLDVTALFGLQGKVAVVTGGASGIGKACAVALAAAGALVVVADRNKIGAQTTATELGGNGLAMDFDLAEEESIEAMFGRIETDLGKLDLLVNNAGIYPRYALEKVTRAQWLEMQQINIWGNFVTMRAAARLMQRGGEGGRIVNVSSIGAKRTAVNDQVAYNASKAALDSMTLSAALEWAPHAILVNSLLPGAVQPLEPKPVRSGHSAATGPLLAPGRMLLGRAAKPEEVVGPILMLLGAAGGYITGQTIVIDGGFSIS